MSAFVSPRRCSPASLIRMDGKSGFDRPDLLAPFVLSEVEARAASAVARGTSFDFAQDERWLIAEHLATPEPRQECRRSSVLPSFVDGAEGWAVALAMRLQARMGTKALGLARVKLRQVTMAGQVIRSDLYLAVCVVLDDKAGVFTRSRMQVS